MNHFHVWCDLKEGVGDREFSGLAQELLSFLHARELIEGYAISRREFVIAPPALGRFHVVVEFATTAQMNRALEYLTAPGGEAEGYHQAVTAALRHLSTALYRDFPEPPPRKPLSL